MHKRHTMNQLPLYIPIVFASTVAIAVYFFYKAGTGSVKTILILTGWLLCQAILGLRGFYLLAGEVMPRFLMLILPPLVAIAVIFTKPTGRRFTGQLNIKWLTMIHILRIPVEMVLYWLYTHQAIPRIMTFEGRNLDILAGLTAPLVYYFGFVKKGLPVKILLAWNFICLGLLMNIIYIAIFSMPFSLQQFGFEQPNIAMFYFPFIWLPCFLVPLVIYGHLAAIRQLLRRKAAELPLKQNAVEII
jgi:hypothetical protein